MYRAANGFNWAQYFYDDYHPGSSDENHDHQDHDTHQHGTYNHKHDYNDKHKRDYNGYHDDNHDYPGHHHHEATPTVIHVETITIIDPRTIVTFSVKGCLPTKMPYNLTACPEEIANPTTTRPQDTSGGLEGSEETMATENNTFPTTPLGIDN